MIVAAVILGIVVIVGLYLMVFYNGLVRGRNLVEEAWSGISVQLKRRHDLIPALVNIVKGYATHETEVLRQITEARAQAIHASPGNVEAVMKAENVLSQALRSLFAVAENYPQLNASENFLQLQEQLAALEDEIQMARRYYNGQPGIRTTTFCSFPAIWLRAVSALAR